MPRPRSATRASNAAIVLEALPEYSQEPVTAAKIAQRVPLTLPEVSNALQRLRLDGQACNPHGANTHTWSRPEPDWSLLAPPVQQQLPTAPDAPVTRAEFERMRAILEALASELGVEVDR